MHNFHRYKHLFPHLKIQCIIFIEITIYIDIKKFNALFSMGSISSSSIKNSMHNFHRYNNLFRY